MNDDARTAAAPRTVHLYVFDGFADWEAAHAVAGIQQPQFQRAPGRFQVRTVAEHRQQHTRTPFQNLG